MTQQKGTLNAFVEVCDSAMGSARVEHTCSICRGQSTSATFVLAHTNDVPECHPTLYTVCSVCDTDSAGVKEIRKRQLELPAGFRCESESFVDVRDVTFAHHRSPETHYTCYCGQVLCYSEVQSQIYSWATRRGFFPYRPPLKCGNVDCLSSIDVRYDLNHVGYNGYHHPHADYVTSERKEHRPHPFAHHVPIHRLHATRRSLIDLSTHPHEPRCGPCASGSGRGGTSVHGWCCQCTYRMVPPASFPLSSPFSPLSLPSKPPPPATIGDIITSVSAFPSSTTRFLEPHLSMLTVLLPGIRSIVASYVGRYQMRSASYIETRATQFVNHLNIVDDRMQQLKVAYVAHVCSQAGEESSELDVLDRLLRTGAFAVWWFAKKGRDIVWRSDYQALGRNPHPIDVNHQLGAIMRRVERQLCDYPLPYAPLLHCCTTCDTLICVHHATESHYGVECNHH